MSQNTIAIIDDNPSFLKLMEKTLQKEGFKTLSFNCSVRAIENLTEGSCDLVLCDFMMPNLNGFGVTEQMVKLQIPVWILSAANDSDKMKSCLKAGANKYKIKTDDHFLLLEEINHFFNQQHQLEDECYLMSYAPLEAESLFQLEEIDNLIKITTNQEFSVGCVFSLNSKKTNESNNFFIIEDIIFNDNYTFTHICKKL